MAVFPSYQFSSFFPERMNEWVKINKNNVFWLILVIGRTRMRYIFEWYFFLSLSSNFVYANDTWLKFTISIMWLWVNIDTVIRIYGSYTQFVTRVQCFFSRIYNAHIFICSNFLNMGSVYIRFFFSFFFFHVFILVFKTEYEYSIAWA